MDPAVRKETGYIALWTVLLSAIMEGVFLVLNQWNLKVLLGNLGGAAAAVGSFFLLAVTVSRAVSSGKPEEAARRVKASAGLRLIAMGRGVRPVHRRSGYQCIRDGDPAAVSPGLAFFRPWRTGSARDPRPRRIRKEVI